MLNEKETAALKAWYSREKLIDQFRHLIEKEQWEELEEHLQMRCLFPISRHSELPDYMLDGEGNPLFPTNLNPKKDLEVWRDAIEVGWAVIAENFNLAHDDLHRTIAKEQKDDWAIFMARYEERKAKQQAAKEAGEEQ
jgi:hypothetical protein